MITYPKASCDVALREDAYAEGAVEDTPSCTVAWAHGIFLDGRAAPARPAARPASSGWKRKTAPPQDEGHSTHPPEQQAQGGDPTQSNQKNPVTVSLIR